VSAVGQLLRQVRYTNKSFWRNPGSAFFTFLFPLLFLVIFTTLLGGGTTTIGNVAYSDKQYYVVSMAAFGVITACYTNIAMSLTFSRDQGILKRLRGTPLPAASYLGARVVHAALIALLLVAITSAFGVFVYSIDVPTGVYLVRFLVTLLVGAGCFTAAGLAVTTLVPNADAAPAIVNAIVLPLLFLSGVFIPIGDSAPAWVRFVGDVFPVKHFFDAMRDAFLQVPNFSWNDVLVLGIWLVAAVAIAAARFRWEPSR
jgi:ABC-2 type transport system permease protein